MNINLLLWSQFLLSQFFFVGIAYAMVLMNGQTKLEELPLQLPGMNGDPLGFVFLTLALLTVAFGYHFPRFMKKENKTSVVNPPPISAPAKTPPVYIIQLVTAETSTLYGLFYAMMRHNPHLILPFALLGIAATLIYYPSRERIDALR